MERVEIGRLEEFASGGVSIRELNGREVGIVRWGDELFAINNDCPHQGGPLCEGHVGPRLISNTEGQIELDASRPLIACAWHGWEFDLRDGQSVWDANYSALTYPVTVEDDGRVFVQVGGRRSRARG